METIKQYPKLGKFSKKHLVASFDDATPWKNANISFNWLNFEYPLLHSHTDWEILVVLQGEILHTINGNSETLLSGTGCLIGPKDNHAFFYPNNKKNDFQGVSIIVRDSYMQTFLKLYTSTLYDELLNHTAPFYFSISRNSIEKYTHLLLSIQSYDNQEYCQQQCNIVFTYLILKIMENNVSPFQPPDTLKSFIRQLNNPSLSKEELQNIQKKLPYSYSQLTRIFKKCFKCTITQYVNRVKMNYAKELLSNTDIPISQIANELEFNSGAHFHTLFKKTFNTTPLNYRKGNI